MDSKLANTEAAEDGLRSIPALTTWVRQGPKCLRGEAGRRVRTRLERNRPHKGQCYFGLHPERHPVMGYYALCGHLGAQSHGGRRSNEKEDGEQQSAQALRGRRWSPQPRTSEELSACERSGQLRAKAMKGRAQEETLSL